MTVLQVEDLSVSFGGVRAVRAVSLSIAKGERHVILGPNGAGKTTLFNLIGGQQRPDSGRITLFGADVTRLSPHRRARAGLARTFQITSLLATLTVEENIHLAVQAFSRSRYAIVQSPRHRMEMAARVNGLLEQWRLGGRESALVSDLSYGDQRKIEIAMALAHQPRLLLLDEPTAGLSVSETENVIALINGLSKDVTVLAIEHDMEVAFEIGQRFTILHQGGILVSGSADAVRSNPEIQSIYFGEVDE